MAIYRGAGGAGDATGDATNAAALAISKANEAAQSATNASSSATSAAASASDAADSASDASDSASAASTSASNASSSATAAASSATDAETAQTAAEAAQEAAEDAESGASTSATNASNSATAAATSATNAASSATAASNSASNASSSASSAATSATNAGNSATSAASSASAAATSETNAASSASSASTSATNAATSATSAASSATTAVSAKTDALAAQSAAETAETNAETAATNASTSASNAATSATNAASSATAAASSATSAASSATAAAASATEAATFDPALYLAKSGNLSGLANTVTAANNIGLNPYGNGFKNRIINGAMMIDQRNSGASVTPTSGTYTLDRWTVGLDQASKFSVQQSSTAPTGFVNSMLCTSLSAYSVLSTDSFQVRQNIEGLNVYDLGWGTASAATVTLSFWVRSSLTGTFGGSIVNSAYDRSYPFSYTISAANTWEQKSVTIAGDTSGTWLTTNGVGIRVCFGLGAGSSKSTTAGAWASGFYNQPTGSVSVVGTNGATLYITGVQLEKGSTATSFDYRPYGTELALCQRYYEVTGMVVYTSSDYRNGYFQVNKRATPTLTLTIATGSGASIAMSNAGYGELSNFFQSAGNSITSGAKVTGSAEL